jgi:hypothetical protein
MPRIDKSEIFRGECMSNTLERKIRFYQVTWAKNDGDKIVKDGDFFESILNKCIQYTSDDVDYELFLEKYASPLSRKEINKTFWKLSKVRNSDYPLKYKYSERKNLPLELMSDEGLSEPVHFIIFDGEIIGSEYNHQGPRTNTSITRIVNTYLKGNPTEGIHRLEIKPIFRKDVYDYINKFREIKGVTIKIATNYAKLLQNEGELSFRDLFSAANLVDDMYLTVGFTTGRGKSKQFSDLETLINGIKKISSRGDLEGNVKALKIEGTLKGHHEPQEFDLLDELLMTESRVAKIDEKTRAVDSIEMYKELLNTYDLLEDDIMKFKYPV